MANIFPRKNKDGIITSYTIRVSRGLDNMGRRLKPYTMSFKPKPGMSQKQIEKELNRTAVMFEDQCRQGYIFSARIICSCCGGYFGSKVWHSTSKYRRVIWQCNHKFNGERCKTPHFMRMPSRINS